MVMPSNQDGLTLLRPVDGAEEDGIGVFSRIEPDIISPSSYPLPDADKAGDSGGAALLREAFRMNLRSGAGPFRSVGRAAATPRPYQYVPLAMALRMSPARLLIADDVGVGKTVEAGFVARELLDRGAAKRIGVLCPPHLCEQWATELRDKFGIDAAVAQSSKMARLERELPRQDMQVFKHYRHIVASIDFVKSDHYAKSFADNAPDLIIVDEAHAASRPRGDASGSQQQRHRLVRELANDPNRHIILVTATPHNGVEESFRSLIGLLNRDLDMPVDRNIPNRRLTPYLVQRRRADLANWLGEDTPFPDRDNEEIQYAMSPAYLALYEDIIGFCRQIVAGVSGQRQRVRYWAAVSILRCVLSSPAAAEATLRARANRLAESQREENASVQEFIAQALDADAETDSPPDYAPTAALADPDAALTRHELRRLDGFLSRARELRGTQADAKLAKCRDAALDMVERGYRPIIYCRFIATAEYVAEQLSAALSGTHPDIEIRSVTGGDGNDEQRKEIIDDIVRHKRRVLVATDCLSEGINLQEHFDAVMHYDLPWNPNRLEQREGRVDRYGQAARRVKAVLLWGANNNVDLTVLQVLIRKAREIRRRLGISVAASVESEAVLEAVINNILATGGVQPRLDLQSEQSEVSAYHRELDNAASAQAKQSAYFAQHSIQPDEIARELKELDPALGSQDDVRGFVANGYQRFNGELRETRRRNVFELYPGDLQERLSAALPDAEFPLRVCFDQTPRADAVSVIRNHPVVSTLADAVMGRAMSDEGDPNFARCGAIYTTAVQRRTAALLLRLRYLLTESGKQTYAEEIVTAAFYRAGGQIHWLPLYQDDAPDGDLRETALALLTGAKPARNMPSHDRCRNVSQMLEMLDDRPGWHNAIVAERKAAILAAHERVRGAIGGKPLLVDAKPPDIIGCYALVPAEG